MKIVDLIIYFMQAGGFTIIVLIVIKGLKQEIKNMQKVVKAQNLTIGIQTETFNAMGKRAEEAEKFKDLYKKFLSELPDDIDNYKRILSGLKDVAINELENALKKKDAELTELSQNKIQDVLNQEKILDELPKLRENLIKTHNSLENKLSALDIFQPGTVLYRVFREMENKVRKDEANNPKYLDK